jgi:hypothetical protein
MLPVLYLVYGQQESEILVGYGPKSVTLRQEAMFHHATYETGNPSVRTGKEDVSLQTARASEWNQGQPDSRLPSASGMSTWVPIVVLGAHFSLSSKVRYPSNNNYNLEVVSARRLT